MALPLKEGMMTELVYDPDFTNCGHSDGQNDDPKLCPQDTESECQCCVECRKECQLEADDV